MNRQTIRLNSRRPQSKTEMRVRQVAKVALVVTAPAIGGAAMAVRKLRKKVPKGWKVRTYRKKPYTKAKGRVSPTPMKKIGKKLIKKDVIRLGKQKSLRRVRKTVTKKRVARMPPVARKMMGPIKKPRATRTIRLGGLR